MRASIVVCALAAVSCASSPINQGVQAFNEGRNQAAFNSFNACAMQGEAACMYNIGVMYHGKRITSPDPRADAVKWYTLAARYGYGPATVQLTAFGAPVPPSDLMRPEREATQAEIDAAGAVGQLIGTALGGGFRKR